MNDPVYQRLREVSWQRRLTETEEAQMREHLATHPEVQADWDLELSLNHAFDQLPDAPLASNFTAQVLQAVEREAAAQARASQKGWGSKWLVWNWMPKVAATVVALGSCVFFYHEHQINARTAMANSVVMVSEAVSASNPELMEDFDAIRQLGDPKPKADTELLALMK
jgi:anti-sigma factor RsiW